MKRLFVLLAAVTFVFSFVSPVLADEVVNSVRAAQVVAGLKIVSYEGGTNYQRGANTGDWVNTSYKMALNGDITYFESNGEVLVSETDPPWKGGLPSNAIKETRGFSLWISALDSQGQSVAFGNFQKDLLLPGEPIEVVRRPSWTLHVVPFTGKGSTLPENAVLKPETGGAVDYAPWAGGFPVWSDPLKTIAYAIVDTITGLTVVSDIIDPSKGTKADDKSVMNLKWIGGVVEVPDGNYSYLDNQKFDGKDANGIPVKVFIWNLNGSAGDINAWSSTDAPMQISILRWIPESAGEMPEVASGNNGYAYVGDGYDKVVVVVTGVDFIAPFRVNFSKPTTPTISGGGGSGGGKG